MLGQNWPLSVIQRTLSTSLTRILDWNAETEPGFYSMRSDTTLEFLNRGMRLLEETKFEPRYIRSFWHCRSAIRTTTVHSWTNDQGPKHKAESRHVLIRR